MKYLRKLAPYRKALIGAAIAGLGALAAQGDIDWKAVAKATLAGLLTGGGVFQATNAPAQ